MINAHPIKPQIPLPISQLCLANTDILAGVGAPPLDTTSNPFRMVRIWIRILQIPSERFEYEFEFLESRSKGSNLDSNASNAF